MVKKFIRAYFQIKTTLLTATGADQAKPLDQNLRYAPTKPPRAQADRPQHPAPPHPTQLVKISIRANFQKNADVLTAPANPAPIG